MNLLGVFSIINGSNEKSIDLGLSVKWASCNVGASSPEEYGDYFAWGEIQPKATYTEVNSKTYNKEISAFSGNLEYDAATANWGGAWRMPTYAECKDLCNKCKWEWVTQNGVKGYRVTGLNGNNIFLPAAGYRLGSSLIDAGYDGWIWSSMPDERSTMEAYSLIFNNCYHDFNWFKRYCGHSVRPVSRY